MKRTLKTESSTFEKDMMSDFPVANRREARKLGLLRSKSSEAERERMEPQVRNERVCGEESDADTRLLDSP
jgi:hypothetical protein